MKQMKKILTPFLLLLALSAESLFAHAGHHDLPGGALKPPHGGILKEAGIVDIEIVQVGNKIKIYILDEKLKPIPFDQLKVDASLNSIRKKTSSAIKLESKKDYYESQLDLKDHRYDLEISVSFKNEKTKAIFQIEPQS